MPQSAMLAGMVQSSSVLNPYTNEEGVMERRSTVLAVSVNQLLVLGLGQRINQLMRRIHARVQKFNEPAEKTPLVFRTPWALMRAGRVRR